MKGINLAKLLVGGFLIFLGLGFLADQFLGINFGQVLGIFWPLAIMMVGIYVILRTKSQIFFGSILFLLGSALLIDYLFDLTFSIWQLWPLILVFFGIRILFTGQKHYDFPKESINEGESFDSTAVFWGDSRKIKSENLKMGKIIALFGGNEIDLTDAKISKSGATIDIVAMFGGVSIKVNPNQLVKSEGLGLFGGFEDKSSKPKNQEDVIYIKGVAIFGGVDIKN